MNGKMTLLNVTISGNIDPVHASGLSIGGGGATLRYVTITANGTSDKTVAGISKTATSGVEIHNSIVWGNGKNPQCGSSQAPVGTLATPFQMRVLTSLAMSRASGQALPRAAPASSPIPNSTRSVITGVFLR
jgi:hypothetical protein